MLLFLLLSGELSRDRCDFVSTESESNSSNECYDLLMNGKCTTILRIEHARSSRRHHKGVAI